MKIENIIIRKAKLSDCQQVYEFGKEKELVNPKGNPPRKWWIEAFIKEKQIFYVAEFNKKIVGFIFGERITGNCCLLHELYVAKEFRKHGIGRGLMKTTEAEIRKRKLKVILVYGNKNVSKFLKNLHYDKGLLLNEYVKFL